MICLQKVYDPEGLEVLQQAIDVFKGFGASLRVLLYQPHENPIIFGAQTSEVARYLLESAASEEEREAWLDSVGGAAVWTVFSHLLAPRGGGETEGTDVTCPALAADLRSFYENREGVCKYYLDTMIKLRGSSSVLHVLRRYRSFLEYLGTQSWLECLLKNGLFGVATPNVMEVLTDHPTDDVPFNAVLLDHYRASRVDYFRTLQLAMSYLRQIGTQIKPSSWDLFSVMRTVADKKIRTKATADLSGSSSFWELVQTSDQSRRWLQAEDTKGFTAIFFR
jgi:hypothetical protein